MNADGRIVSGVDDEPTPEPTDSIDAACERLGRTRPQQLFDTFADMELDLGTHLVHVAQIAVGR